MKLGLCVCGRSRGCWEAGQGRHPTKVAFELIPEGWRREGECVRRQTAYTEGPEVGEEDVSTEVRSVGVREKRRRSQ